MSTQAVDKSGTKHGRDSFGTRRVFILAAIGSAVGLGNIWRFPYVAYENGGGAFIIPYLVALLTAGIPFLFLDYAVGHRYRGSAPLSFRRIARGAEPIGWWMTGICAVIAIYYAAIIAWAIRYTFFSIEERWGDDPNAFFFGEFLQAADTPGASLDLVPGVFWPLLLLWIVVVGIMVLGVQKGIGRMAIIFMPLLLLVFAALVVRALFLDGAGVGLDALFSPNWAALTETSVWVAAFGQIFFSLSVGFGIMITYASYVRRRTDMTGSGAVVGFSNSGFELLAGIGVFAALGFMATAAAVPVDEVATSGLGLAFVAFPTIVSEAPGGGLLGVLFFASLVVAGLTSLVSVLEVVVSAVREKIGLSRVSAALWVGLPAAVLSIGLFSTTTGVYVLDTMDHFVNSFGILAAAVASMVALTFVFRKLPVLMAHMNKFGTIRLGRWWQFLVGGLAPAALAFILFRDFMSELEAPYEGYPSTFINIFGWGMVVALIVVAIGLSFLPWSRHTPIEEPGYDDETNSDKEAES
ncbi:sodium-dependent transporter [Antrihabitans sp. YC3-6]|uniref:Transporter n=1 Tax=Antrihabitans stalagmiti TaxID=2799499 RepID=A0A934U4M8_9NOCA|nr:sodium-dependent transporter [Antrihabitans stalagmiti]MBJ8339963.1 sodium-dependent transporter [Antrihabitans stalagmiti]